MTMSGPRNLILLACLTATPATAEPFAAAYAVTYGGVTMGNLRVNGETTRTGYSVRLDGGVNLLGYAATLDAAANGSAHHTVLRPENYRMTIDRPVMRTVAVSFGEGHAADTRITPELDEAERKERVPLGVEHRIGVSDPLTAMVAHFVRAGRTGKPCEGVARVYSGESRFDVVLEPEQPTAAEIVCKATVRMIAGHKRLTGREGPPTSVRVVFAAQDRGGVLLPARFEMSMPVGTIVIRRAVSG